MNLFYLCVHMLINVPGWCVYIYMYMSVYVDKCMCIQTCRYVVRVCIYIYIHIEGEHIFGYLEHHGEEPFKLVWCW